MTLKVAVIGAGYWGPNFVRNFIQYPQTDLVSVADLSRQALNKIKSVYPQVETTTDYRPILDNPNIDLVLITTPPETHFQIALEALKKNKHLIVAKPLTLNSKQASKLLKMAISKNLLLHGDLTYIYTGAVEYIEKFVRQGKLGKVLYYDSTRANLGLIQKETSVIWDLVPHDLAILEHCFHLKLKQVFASASKHYQNSKNYEMAHITLTYENNFIAHIHVSWISPVKLRTILLGGSRKMIYYNDVEPDEKIRIYDKGIDIQKEDISYMKPVYRSGDAVIPKLKTEEAIYSEIDQVVKMIIAKKISYRNALMNSQIIKILEACDRSVESGKPVVFK